jgi:hypothetical protein
MLKNKSFKEILSGHFTVFEYDGVEKAVVEWLQERLNAIPDETWDQFQQRKSIIALVEELTS